MTREEKILVDGIISGICDLRLKIATLEKAARIAVCDHCGKEIEIEEEIFCKDCHVRSQNDPHRPAL